MASPSTSLGRCANSPSLCRPPDSYSLRCSLGNAVFWTQWRGRRACMYSIGAEGGHDGSTIILGSSPWSQPGKLDRGATPSLPISLPVHVISVYDEWPMQDYGVVWRSRWAEVETGSGCPSPPSQIGASPRSGERGDPQTIHRDPCRTVDLAFSMNARGSKYLQPWDIDPRTRNDVGDLSLCRKRHPPNL